MGRDTTYQGTATQLTGLKRYVSSIAIAETASAAAILKFRDTIAPPTTAPTAVDGAAGNVTTGLHMLAASYVTRWGESIIGARSEFTAAGSKIATVTVPVGPTTGIGAGSTRDYVIGRRLYATKAGAPVTTVTPTSAQWFLILADLSTTCAAGMAALSLNGQSSITVASTTGFGATGNILVTTDTGIWPVAYTSVDATTFIGCTLLQAPATAQGLMTSGGAVTQPMIGNNTSTTYSWNLADANLANTRPPTVDAAGRVLRHYKILTSTTLDVSFGSNVLALENGGGLGVELNSGAAAWEVSGS